MKVWVVEAQDEELHRSNGHVVSLVRSADQSPRGRDRQLNARASGSGLPARLYCFRRVFTCRS
jgi:hypothetical protein